jgi:hypothetical protein
VNPRITVRNLPNPLNWKKAGTNTSWHHIIPFMVLRDVWNRLVDQHIATQIPEARVAIRQYLLLVDRNLPNADSMIDRMRAENTDQKRAGHHRLMPLTVAEANSLATAAVWPAWNAVEGPQLRSDDPADHYFDRFTSGLTAEEASRMLVIERLFHQLSAFSNSGPVPGPSNLNALTQAASSARPVLNCDMPIAYRSEMWTADGNGRWRKRRDGESYTPAGA